MFWNKKRKQRELEEMVTWVEDEPEPKISEPIKSFLDSSHRWVSGQMESDEDGNVRWTAADPDTGLCLVIRENPYLFGTYVFCDNHDWVTPDEAIDVYREIRAIHKAKEEESMRLQRQEWVEAYQNLEDE